MTIKAELSIVIPAINEAQSLPLLLTDLAAQKNLHLEIIVVDGGSTDDTLGVAASSGARVLSSQRGRGRQMNAGARCATAPLLLFLHADSRLCSVDTLSRALDSFKSEGGENESIAGHFPLHFERQIGDREPMFRFMEAKTRSGRRGTINGDQGLLISQKFFRQLGEFEQDFPFFEDQRIAARIFDLGRWLLLPDTLRTSARRFESEGPVRRYALMCLMMSMHEAGFEEYFQQLPGLYAQQDQTHELKLDPFIRKARSMTLQRVRSDPRLVQHIGRFVRSNIWQLALAADLMDPVSDTVLKAFERMIEPRLANPVVDTISAFVGAGALLGLWPLAEHIQARFEVE